MDTANSRARYTKGVRSRPPASPKSLRGSRGRLLTPILRQSRRRRGAGSAWAARRCSAGGDVRPRPSRTPVSRATCDAGFSSSGASVSSRRARAGTRGACVSICRACASSFGARFSTCDAGAASSRARILSRGASAASCGARFSSSGARVSFCGARAGRGAGGAAALRDRHIRSRPGSVVAPGAAPPGEVAPRATPDPLRAAAVLREVLRKVLREVLREGVRSRRLASRRGGDGLAATTDPVGEVVQTVLHAASDNAAGRAARSGRRAAAA